MDKEEKEWINTMIHDPDVGIVFYHKKKEYEELVSIYQYHVNQLCKILVASVGNDKFYAECLLQRFRRLLSESIRMRDRFMFYYKVNKGKVDLNGLSLDEIKKIPIGNFITGPSVIGGNNKRRKFICPFHNEKTESFIWYTDSNTYYCFGCNIHGDIIDFYMKMYKVDFKNAIKELSKLI